MFLLYCDSQQGAERSQAMTDGRAQLQVTPQIGHCEVIRLRCNAGAEKHQAIVGSLAPLYNASQQGHLEGAGIKTSRPPASIPAKAEERSRERGLQGAARHRVLGMS